MKVRYDVKAEEEDCQANELVKGDDEVIYQSSNNEVQCCETIKQSSIK